MLFRLAILQPKVWVLISLLLTTGSGLMAIEDSCVHLWSQPTLVSKHRRRSIDSIDKIRIASFNVKTLFYGELPFSSEGPKQLSRQSLERAHSLARSINESDPDFIVMQEVEHARALEYFADEFLSSQYLIHTIESVDPYGRHIAVMMRKSLPFVVRYESNIDQKWYDPTKLGTPEQKTRYLFQRDLPVLMIYEPDNALTKRPLFALVGFHLKSRRNRPHDPSSEVHRRAQVFRASEIIYQLHHRFDSKVPIILAGDFNTDINRNGFGSPVSKDHELNPLFQLGFRNSFDLQQYKVEVPERATHVYFDQKKRPHDQQIDGILVLEDVKNTILNTAVQEFIDEDGTRLSTSFTLSDKESDPSDHRLIYTDFDFQKLRFPR